MKKLLSDKTVEALVGALTDLIIKNNPGYDPEHVRAGVGAGIVPFVELVENLGERFGGEQSQDLALAHAGVEQHDCIVRVSAYKLMVSILATETSELVVNLLTDPE